MARSRKVMLRTGSIAIALALSACSSGSGSAAPSTSPTSAGATSTSAAPMSAAPGVDPEVLALLSLSPAQQEAELATVSAAVERDLFIASGLEAELGGPDPTDKAFAALTGAIMKQADAYRNRPSFGRFGGLVAAAGDASLGGLMFAGWLVAGLGSAGIVAATNDAEEGAKPVTQKSKDPDGTGTYEITGSVDKASSVTTFTQTTNGVTGKLRVTVDIAPCPTASGEFTSKILMEASATSAAGRTGSNVTMQIDVTGRVGDDAEMTGYDVTTRTQAADFKNSKGSYVDVSGSVTWTGSSVTAAENKVSRSAGAATPEMAQQWATAGTLTQTLVNSYALEAAQKAWKSGRCVNLKISTDPTTRTGLAPSTTVAVTAAPRSKVDQSAVGGTVSGTLNGASSLTPANSPVPADATFSYVAPSEKDQSATDSFESRSKRGVGKAEVTFDTKGGTGFFVSAGSGGTYTTTGLGIGAVTEEGSLMATIAPADVCDVTVPFTLSNPDTGGQQVFTPTSGTGGRTSYTLSFPLTGFTESGKGTYTLSVDGETGTIRTKVKGRLTLPGSGMSWKTRGTQVFDLGPSTTCP